MVTMHIRNNAPIEGDLIEDSNGIIFDVKGFVHPPHRVVAYPRFIPAASGTRKHGERAYLKVYSFQDRFSFLKKRLPDYLVDDAVFGETLCEVPKRAVRRHFKPVEKLQQLRKSKKLDDLESQALGFAEILKEKTKISWNHIGVSGSINAGLHTNDSDIDLMIYGFGNCIRAHSALKELIKNENTQIKPYSIQELRKLFAFRSKDTKMSFEDFVRTESRKAMQGKFSQRDYFIRFVKNWREIDERYGDVRYKKSGYSKIEAKIVDASESILTPCTYRLANTRIIDGSKSEEIEEIVSFRGRFCEQAGDGETVIAQGKVEHLTDHKHDRQYSRLLLGNKPSDFMILV